MLSINKFVKHIANTRLSITNIIYILRIKLPLYSSLYFLFRYSLKEVHTNIEAMSRLTDHILYEIEYSLDPNLITAQNLLKNLQNRNLYKFVGSYNLNVVSIKIELL